MPSKKRIFTGVDIRTAIPLSTFLFGKLRVSYYGRGILHVYVLPDVLLELDDLQKALEFIDALGPSKFLNLFEFDTYSVTDDHVRKWAADPQGNHRTIADAIVINGLDQKILADAYLRYNKPVRPTRIFGNVQEATDWLLETGKNTGG